MAEMEEPQTPPDLFYLIDTAQALVIYDYDKTRNVFHQGHAKIPVETMRRFHQWIGNRLT